ncbi:MAG: redoxin domain-containing protein [Bacteroidales bacterium]|nr:redoxin domain-containing protein [Bacteroidales bacterium]
MTEHLTKADFLTKVFDYENNKEWKYQGELPAMIDFYADWCAPCRTSSPILEELAKEYSGKINVYKIDTQKEQELAQVFGIQSIPAFLYCPMEGKPTMASGIAPTAEETKQMFRDQIDNLLLQ